MSLVVSYHFRCSLDGITSFEHSNFAVPPKGRGCIFGLKLPGRLNYARLIQIPSFRSLVPNSQILSYPVRYHM